MEKKKDANKTGVRSSAAADSETKGTAVLSPPTFNVTGANGAIQQKKDGSDTEVHSPSSDHELSASLSGSPAQMKKPNADSDNKVTLPETLGPTQTGPIATKGEGDDHAFSPTDINQGSIGDCYFLAALAGVAHTNPKLLKDAISQNSDGTFTIKLFTSEEKGMLFWKKKVFTPHYVTIYPTFPVSVDGTDTANENASANPAHAHGGDKDDKGKVELWVRLIEKAYAVLMGSYAAIGNGGFSAEALETLTGKAYTEKVLGKKYKKKIIAMVEAGEPTAVGTSDKTWEDMSDDDKKWARENSIVGGHAYTVMAADDSKITVRNPWGAAARKTVVEMTWARFKRLFNQYSEKD